MYKCPACGIDDVMGQSRCHCGADLSLLLTLDGVADAWFNKGVAALAADAPGEALEWFSACCTARPADIEARLAQAKTWAQLGHFREALAALEKIRQIDPANGELKMVSAAIENIVKENDHSDHQNEK